MLTPNVTVSSRFVEISIRCSTSHDYGFIGLKNKSCSKSALSQPLDGLGFILVEEAFINQRTAVYFSFRGNKKSEKRNTKNRERK
jgi:hypothetical protein